MVEAASGAASGTAFEIVSPAEALFERLEGGDAFDMVFVDFEAPEMGGLKGLPVLRAAAGARPIGVFMSGASPELARRLAAQGAQAVLPRQISAAGLLAVIELLSEGHTLSITKHVTPLDGHQRASQLSERELQVLTGICEGLQNKEIAHAFEVQEVTVKMHVRAIIRKLGARNRTHAAMIARDLGIC